MNKFINFSHNFITAHVQNFPNLYSFILQESQIHMSGSLFITSKKQSHAKNVALCFPLLQYTIYLNLRVFAPTWTLDKIFPTIAF